MLETSKLAYLTAGFFILFVLVTSVSGTSPIIATSVPGSAENPSVVEHTANWLSQIPSPLNSRSMGSFNITANATLGKWKAYVDYQPTSWNPGTRVETNITLFFSRELLSKFKRINPNIDKACILITAERDFDPMGLQHVPWNYQASTLLTPGGLPIEGGGMKALSRFTGLSFRTPVDVMLEVPISSFCSGWRFIRLV